MGITDYRYLTEYNEAEVMRMFREEAWEEGYKEGLQEAYEEEVEKGEEKICSLVVKLLAEGRSGDIEKIITDKAARKALYKEFGIV